jgi:hypothetical protein
MLVKFFVFIIIPMLMAWQIAARTYPVPGIQAGTDGLITLMDKRTALAWKIFLVMMALLGGLEDVRTYGELEVQLATSISHFFKSLSYTDAEYFFLCHN